MIGIGNNRYNGKRDRIKLSLTKHEQIGNKTDQ